MSSTRSSAKVKTELMGEDGLKEAENGAPLRHMTPKAQAGPGGTGWHLAGLWVKQSLTQQQSHDWGY